MRKSTKLAILVAALVALCSIAALAADTWKQDGDNWYCYDKDGNMIYGEARKSGSSYYYLDESTGAMATNRLVDDGTNKYYYGEDGARVLGAWVKVAVDNDGDGWEYMYFQAVSGKAYVGKTNVTINGKKYSFKKDTGYMVYGFVDENGDIVDNVSSAVGYYGAKEDGSAQTGWYNVVDGADEVYPDDASIWFYFKNGAKIYNKVQYKVASGKKYNFGLDGKMVTGWAIGTASDTGLSYASASYYGGADDGQIAKKQWIKTYHFTNDEDTEKWYYLDSTGIAQKPGVAKISGKYYLFNTSRQMVSGVVAIKVTDALDPKSADPTTIKTFSTLDAFKAYAPEAGYKVMYFSGSADTDGAMKVGSQTITIDGEEATIVLDKHGMAYEGINSKKIYVNGILQTAGDSKVAVKKLRVTVPGSWEASYYLVNAAGTILKNTKQIDADGVYWVAKGDYTKTADAEAYKVYKIADKDGASACATAFLAGKETFTYSSETYKVGTPVDSGSGYWTVDFAK